MGNSGGTYHYHGFLLFIPQWRFTDFMRDLICFQRPCTSNGLGLFKVKAM